MQHLLRLNEGARRAPGFVVDVETLAKERYHKPTRTNALFEQNVTRLQVSGKAHFPSLAMNWTLDTPIMRL